MTSKHSINVFWTSIRVFSPFLFRKRFNLLKHFMSLRRRQLKIIFWAPFFLPWYFPRSSGGVYLFRKMASNPKSRLFLVWTLSQVFHSGWGSLQPFFSLCLTGISTLSVLQSERHLIQLLSAYKIVGRAGGMRLRGCHCICDLSEVRQLLSSGSGSWGRQWCLRSRRGTNPYLLELVCQVVETSSCLPSKSHAFVSH